MPQLSKVGDGWGGTEDYATLALWEAAESGIDYGAGNPINAQCKGHVGTVTSLSSTPVNGAEIYTDGVTYDGSNGDDLAVANALTIGGNGYHIHDLKTTSTNAFNRVFSISPSCSLGTFERMLVRPDVVNLQTDAFRVDCQSNNVVVRNIVIDGNGANDGVFFRFGDYCDIASITIINATDGLVGSSASTIIVDSLVLGASRDIVTCKTVTNCADNATNSQADLVDPNNGDYRIKSTSTLVGLGIGAFFETSGGGGHTITLDTIVLSPSINAPEVTQDKLIVAGNIGSTLVNFNPVVTIDKLITLGTIDPTSFTNDPAITFDKLIELSHVSSTLVTYNPSITNDKFILGPELTSTLVTYNPALVKDKLITAPILPSTVEVFNPEILGPILVFPDPLESTVLVRMPEFKKDKLISLEELTLPATMYNQTVTGGFRVDPDLKLYTAEGYGLHIRSGEKLLEEIKTLQLRVKLLELDQS